MTLTFERGRDAGLKFKQVYRNNMSYRSEPKIEKTKVRECAEQRGSSMIQQQFEGAG